MTAALMAELFPVKRMFFSGIAGAVDPKVHVGDLVIPTKWAQYQYVKYVKKAPAGQAGFTDYAIDFPNKFYTINNKVPSALYPTAAPPAKIAKDGCNNDEPASQVQTRHAQQLESNSESVSPSLSQSTSQAGPDKTRVSVVNQSGSQPASKPAR